MSIQKDKLKLIQKEYKAYDWKEITYDIYCDRVNFIGSSFFPLSVFCDNRGIVWNRDRGGYSIDIKDAEKIGLPVSRDGGVTGYTIQCRDLRKDPIKYIHH